MNDENNDDSSGGVVLGRTGPRLVALTSPPVRNERNTVEGGSMGNPRVPDNRPPLQNPDPCGFAVLMRA